MPAPPRDDKPGALRPAPPPPPSDPESGAGGPLVPAPRPSGSQGDARRLYRAGDIIAQKYRLTRLLGEGGMGAVWLSRNLKLDVDVAIKLIRHELATAETSRRLLQEARAAARIGHRSIVRIFDFGETELDDPFIVMEVLTGESLRDVLDQRGRLTATNAVRTLLPIASALVEAHASGIVHRDLKPENIMLVPDTSGGAIPKLVDFGIAKFRRGDGGDDVAAGNLVVGTPDYMSPEQAGGRDEVDEATDVWALGVILYEAITGRVPFGGTSYPALIFAIMAEEPTPTHEQLAGDAELWGILQGALAKRNVGRPSMRAFGTVLAEWAMARGIESDITGTSLAAHWIVTSKRNPFSAVPPPMPDERGSVAEIVSPTLPPAPRSSHPLDENQPSAAGVARRIDPSPPPRSPRRTALGLAVAAVALVVALVLAGRRPPLQPPPAAATTTAASAPVAPAAAVPVTTASSDVVPAAPSAVVSSEAPVAQPGPTGAPAGSARQAGTKAGPKKQPTRKSSLSIAKQPNF